MGRIGGAVGMRKGVMCLRLCARQPAIDMKDPALAIIIRTLVRPDSAFPPETVLTDRTKAIGASEGFNLSIEIACDRVGSKVQRRLERPLEKA